MNIIIAGCGKVGQELAAELSSENHGVTVMDTDPEALEAVTNATDVLGYQGDCTSFRAQIEAGIRDADLLIAVTGQDEKNMLACLIAKKAGKCQTIARVRRPQYSQEIGYLKEELGLSMVINPERAAAAEMERLIQIPSALEVDTFAKGRVNLISLIVPEGSLLDGLTIKDLPSRLNMNTLICVINHGKEVIIPNGDSVIHAGDKISVTVSMADVSEFLNRIGIKTKKVKNVLIAGGGTMGYYLAKRLLNLKINVKIIEENSDRCDELSALLPRAMIINGDATDRALLAEEDLRNVDAVAALMEHDEENILLALYASYCVKLKVMTKIHRNSYESLTEDIHVGNIISTKRITSDYITRYVRSMQNSVGSDVEALYKMMDDTVEALEFNIGEDYTITGIPLKDLKVIPNALICCINRKGKIIRPGGNDTIETGDSVVVVTTKKRIKSINEIIQR